MVELARYRGKEIFLDPFCGSGTICIEAALTACNRAPGMGRNFAAQKWDGVPQSVWQQARTEAMDHEFRGDYQIHGSDCDPKSLQIAIANAKKAGMSNYITFSQADATKRTMPAEQGVLVTNPPYGQRLMEQRAAQQLYRQLGQHLKTATGWRQYIITSEPEFEHYFGRRADKKRKLYNGMIKCDLYQYL